MNATRNIGHLREHLFDQLEMLCDNSKTVDLERARMVCEVSEQIIDAARIEIQFAQVMKGALTVPFIEDQTGASERPNTPLQPSLPDAQAPTQRVTAEELTQRALSAGPPADHPWRGLVGRRVHRLEK